MKISVDTMQVLSNFSGINESIFVEAGSVLRSIDNGKSIIAKAKVQDEFPKDFAIYDLHKFLSTINMFPGADIEFNDDFCSIRYDQSDIMTNYTYAHPDAIFHSEKDIPMPPTEINFKLTKDDLGRIITAQKAMDQPDLLIQPEGKDKVSLSLTDTNNSSAHVFKIVLDAELEIEDFSVIIDMKSISSLLVKDYDIGITSKMISHFNDENVQYWLAVKSNSTFG